MEFATPEITVLSYATQDILTASVQSTQETTTKSCSVELELDDF